MLYAPHFKLRAFDTLSDEAKIPALIRLLEALIGVNEAWLRENPHAPSLYASGVRYLEEPRGQEDWQDIPETILLRSGDCEDLGSWRVAELRVRSNEHAMPHVKRSLAGPRTIFHVAVRRANGQLEDPSRILGMH
ncbi:MAG TPA: hypothetical protein VF407_20925 [Polyangiaceae bacterium]